ncbi:RidA family protein [Roseateles sp. DAIF2]|uniref:RidA family protein n=1 Tax=Roseateles sp. DAIF2 TaxID=2714952 RepID=UPI0018A32B67|nr:RidA family protein [Roseateles sp. DAIF2]QPF74107.1 RidA family protein [Roseateles sp. DAIF2]
MSQTATADLDLALPPAPPQPKHYDVVVVHRGIAHVAGQVSRAPDRVVAGHLLSDADDLSEAREAARVSIRRVLAALRDKLGSLDRIEQVLSLRGFVNAAPGFTRHAEVLDAASELLQAHLGPRGRHARSAIGATSIPGNGLTEIELTVAVREEA